MSNTVHGSIEGDKLYYYISTDKYMCKSIERKK